MEFATITIALLLTFPTTVLDPFQGIKVQFCITIPLVYWDLNLAANTQRLIEINDRINAHKLMGRHNQNKNNNIGLDSLATLNSLFLITNLCNIPSYNIWL